MYLLKLSSIKASYWEDFLLSLPYLKPVNSQSTVTGWTIWNVLNSLPTVFLPMAHMAQPNIKP